MGQMAFPYFMSAPIFDEPVYSGLGIANMVVRFGVGRWFAGFMARLALEKCGFSVTVAGLYTPWIQANNERLK